MKIDLHVHAEERSACAQAGEQEMSRAAMKRGLDGLMCNSDAHRANDVGCYFNRLAHRPQDDEELILMLGAGKYQCDGGG